ncbi:MAG: UDP-N-acetylmuramoyl-L-alanine--D-glutamate ligase [Deltaproteobacteria bacterium]|nr:UDP-N-acetylmuramoyl-L-alanine--D-glutamate ligase [Deltaproteobacteria bacterium]
MELAGKRVLVVGLGVSGRAAALLCRDHGARVTACDLSPAPAGMDELASAGVRLILGAQPPLEFTAAEVVVLSPGVDHRRPEVEAAVEAGALVLGELELAWRFLATPAVAITGTNGKSTVTTLVGRMLAQGGQEVFVGGNLGTPLAEYVRGPQRAAWAVLEVSSFQTDTALTLRPRVAVILNITDDHLDRYESFAAYGDSKFRLLAQQAGDDVAVLCGDDPEVMARRHLAPAQAWAYGAAGPRRPGGWLEQGQLVLAPVGGGEIRLAPSPALPGEFNLLNQLAAGLAALAAGAAPEHLARALGEFRALRHRLELVALREGVAWFDDSKGTNVGAVAAALRAVERPTVLLLGGRDKEGRFAALGPLLAETVRLVILFGEAGPAIQPQIAGFAPLRRVEGLAEAVALAKAEAQPGDAVLLSPGCASFDAYPGYAARGEHFQSLVKGGVHG